jgi:hypothetical protein
MFRWFTGSSHRQLTEEEQWVARREIQEQVDLARKTQTEWEAMIKKWEANDYKDFDWGCQAKMNEVICSVCFFMLFRLINYKMKPLFLGKSDPRSVSCDYLLTITISSFPLLPW